MLELDNIKLQTTWNDAAQSINLNFATIDIVVERLSAALENAGVSFDSIEMWKLLGLDTAEQIASTHLTDALAPYALKTYVDQSIANLIGGAPTTLDTLKEIADAIAEGGTAMDALVVTVGQKASQSDLDAAVTRVGTLEGYFTSGKAKNADKLDGYDSSAFLILSKTTEQVMSGDLKLPNLKATGAISAQSANAQADVLGSSFDEEQMWLALDATNEVIGIGHIPVSDILSALSLATTESKGLMSAADKTKLDNLSAYTLPLAASGTRGGIRIGYNGSGTNGSHYNMPVLLSGEKAYVQMTKSRIETALGFTPADNAKMDDYSTTTEMNTAIAALEEVYLKLTGGTLTGLLEATAGLRVCGRLQNNGDDEGIVVSKASNGCAGVCLGDPTGVRSVFYLGLSNVAFWRYHNGSSFYDITHPAQTGTIALTSDLNSYYRNYGWWAASESNHDANYLVQGSVFAYEKTHSNCATTGPLLDISTDSSYRLQLQASYVKGNLYSRILNGDNQTWTSWKRLMFSESDADLTIKKTSASATMAKVGNSLADIALYVAASGSRGIYDATADNWLIYTEGTNTIFPSIGRVLIGTTFGDSVSKLVVSGGANISTGYIGSNPALGALNTSNTFNLTAAEGGGSYGLSAWIKSNGNTYLQVGRNDGTATAYNLILQALGGKVAIGRESADATLDVFGSAIMNTDLLLYADSARTRRLTMRFEDGVFRMYNYASSAYQDLVIGTNSNTSGLYYDASAKYWGIDTATPAYKLDVNGSAKAAQLIVSSTAPTSHLIFSRQGYNYITAPPNGYFAFVSNGKTGGAAANADLIIGPNMLHPGITNLVTLGTNAYRWLCLYTTDVKASGNITATGAISAQGANAAASVLNLDYLPLSGGTVNGNLTVTGEINANYLDVDGIYCGGNMSMDGDLAIAGDVTVSGAVAAAEFTTSSDERLKDFHKDLKVDFAKLKAIPKVFFTWKNGDTETMQLGTSAQKVEEVLPELVREGSNGYKRVVYDRLGIVALAAIDVLHDIQETQEEKITRLEKRVKELESWTGTR